MKKDTLFLEKKSENDFEFDESVADVFEDMLNRSIPMYSGIQNLMLSFCEQYSNIGDTIVDLGCSHGFTCLNLASKLDRKIIGIDNSIPMINKAVDNLSGNTDLIGQVDFEYSDINPHSIKKFSNSNVFILSLTLQFIRPLERPRILKSILNSLKPNGILLLIEKTVLPGNSLNKTYIDLYHGFKKYNGYTDTEIAKKRIALENVLVPFSIEENINLLKDVGFSETATFFQWLNFSGIIAIK